MSNVNLQVGGLYIVDAEKNRDQFLSWFVGNGKGLEFYLSRRGGHQRVLSSEQMCSDACFKR